MNKKTISVAVMFLMLLVNLIIFAPMTRATYDIYVDDNAAPGWYDAMHVHTIQEGVNNATSGQSIYVYGGTYPETLSGSAYITITSKSLTIVGEQADMPVINPNMTSSKYVFNFAGSSGYSVTLQYLNISNLVGATISGDIGILTGSASICDDVTVDHCIIHDINWGVKAYGNVTVTNCTMYNIQTGVETGTPGGTWALLFDVQHNIIYDSPTAGSSELIRPKNGAFYGNISYNYLAGNRIGIWVDPEGVNPTCKYGGNWTVTHNTIVSRYNPSNPGNMSQGISFASVSDNFSKIDCRDNLFSGCNYYAIQSGYTTEPDPFSDNMTVRNCLFYNTFTSWLNPVSAQKYFQWNGTGYSTNITYGPTDVHTIAGWDKNTTTDYIFNFQNSVLSDPKLNGTGPAPDCWGLQYGSPAVGTASDGTNIGASQYIPLSPNNPPTFGTPSPTNGSTNQNPAFTWSIPINDPDGDTFNWTIQCNGQSSSTNGASNGTKTVSLSGLSYNKTYTVWVNATDLGSGQWNRSWYTFTTKIDSAPTFGTPSPTNGSTGQDLGLTWSIPINDPDGDMFNWTVVCSNGQSSSANGASNGTKSLSISGTYITTYTVWVNATDGYLWTRAYYTFTTKPNSPPSFGTPSPTNGSTNQDASLFWAIPINDTEGDLFNWTIQCNSGNVTSANNETNGTKEIYIYGLNYNTTYTIWVNATDSIHWTYAYYTFTTKHQPWDIIVDNIVDYLDVSALVVHYGETGTPGWIPEDVNSDGVVNYLDISLLVSHYGETY